MPPTMPPTMPPSMPPARHQPLVVTAHLQQGAALDTLFGTALDGLLASAVRDQAKADQSQQTGQIVTGSLLDGGLRQPEPTVVELPLARCPHTTNHTWHWLATTAFPADIDGRLADGDYDVHHQHCRVRERLVDHTVTRIPASLPPASGRYRLRRLPVVTTPASRLIWHAVGDPQHLTTLLANIPSIGRRRHTGEGTVLRWDITTTNATNPVLHAHLHPNGNLGRPTPQACMQALGITADRTGKAGLRPPYWHPATQHNVHLPPPIGGQPDAPA